MPIVLLPDAGPLITLAYADALDLLLKPGWGVQLVDMVLHELTRQSTPTSTKIADWVKAHAVTVLPTQTHAAYQRAVSTGQPAPKANLGELAIQEVMHGMALDRTGRAGVFLFEDHRIARASFLLPENCRKVSTRAYLIFLEERGWIDSAADVERAALAAGRKFSELRFPPK